MVAVLEKKVDVAVIGGGPTGLSACLELAKDSGMTTALFESDTELGGIPRSCHFFFGMRDMKRLYTGPGYARTLDRLVRRTPVDIYTGASVTQIVPPQGGGRHLVKVVTQDGLLQCECTSILLATGCFERSRESRRIPGTRPAGIFTTGSLQQIVNLQKVKPGKKALILGSEHVSLSAALTLKRSKTKIVGMVSEDPRLQTYPIAAKAISSALGFSLFKGASIEAIFGKKRVEGVRLVWEDTQRTSDIECDMIVCTGRFRPDAALIYKTGIIENPASLGPEVDTNFMTSQEHIFAAGNILRGADMHDICALEGRMAARRILESVGSKTVQEDTRVAIEGMHPIRHVVPQKLVPEDLWNQKTPFRTSIVSTQVSRSLKKVLLEAWSGDRKIWSRRYARLIANKRLPVPVDSFDWSKVDRSRGIVLKARLL